MLIPLIRIRSNFMPTLQTRLRLILEEQNIKQVDFARTVGVSANYINLLANGKKLNISLHLAKIIEDNYGYSRSWILSGKGERLMSTTITPLRLKLMQKINQLNEKDLNSVLGFIQLLEEISHTI